MCLNIKLQWHGHVLSKIKVHACSNITCIKRNVLLTVVNPLSSNSNTQSLFYDVYKVQPTDSFHTCNRMIQAVTRNTCTQQPLARLPNLFNVILRLHTAINRDDFESC